MTLIISNDAHLIIIKTYITLTFFYELAHTFSMQCKIFPLGLVSLKKLT